MEKRTILAVLLSMGVMIVFLMIQDAMNPQQPAPPPGQQVQELAELAQEDIFREGAIPVVSPAFAQVDAGLAEAADVEIVPLQEVVVETNRLRVVLSNALGNIVSFQLLNHLDRGQPVEMILTGDAPSQAFAVVFGNLEDVMAERVRPEYRNFRVNRVSDLIVEFSQEFGLADGRQFSMTKRYEFQPNEYMFELSIVLEGGALMHYFSFQGAAYTLVFGPQIGPSFTRLVGRHEEFREFMAFDRGARRGRLSVEAVTDRAPSAVITTQPSWAAIVGKYFALAVMPLTPQYHIGFSIREESGLSDASRMYVTRPALIGSRHEDRFRFYFGPKNHQNLIIYERGDNAFGLRDTGLIELSATRGFWAILSPLENGLRWLLTFFYTRTVPNYGVAIIFLTILVKVVLFPLTKKASEGTLRMQALAPKIKEIQERNKGNPQKMNAEMGEFYRREGYNPLSGCLPMVLQLPIFLAMFNLFNTHFDLRGAMFIPGWITDLSVPESVWDFPEGAVIPLLGWNALRILPFIYVASQLLYGKVVQTPDQKGNKMMKYMLYAMPIVFFFVLYNMPSGLLVYWIMSNILTMVQQMSINKYMARKKALAAAAAPPPPPKPVIAPGGSKKKKRR
ncbi:MAG: membrane protein insertase YidC [Treponema sp.]|nr:membrane protein insertase YidC [Treponema sp.]